MTSRSNFEEETAKNPKKSSTGVKNDATSASDSEIKAHIEELARKGTITGRDISKLYEKFGHNDDIVDRILRKSSKQKSEDSRKARKAAHEIYSRYQDSKMPLHDILEKMMRYKIKNKWSDYKYEEFRKELSALVHGQKLQEIDNDQQIIANRSKINRALGAPSVSMFEGGLNIKESEYGIVDEIIRLYETNLQLHASVSFQSLLYKDCGIVAMRGDFDRARSNAAMHIHPIIAAMFLPKIEIFDLQMLRSNFGRIVKDRFEKKPISGDANCLLFSDITSDPNDVVCNVTSAISDLRNRFKFQLALYDIVFKLRDGKYYPEHSIIEFSKHLAVCRNNIYDNADTLYQNDEGSMIRRILSIFSLRPTITITQPIASLFNLLGGPQMYGNIGLDPRIQMGGSSYPYQYQPLATITRVPMISLRLPPYYNAEKDEPLPLTSALAQTIWINENKTILPKQHRIVNSNEVLIFYVNRRLPTINIRTFTNPLCFSQVPLAMNNFEKLNRYPIGLDSNLYLREGDDVYYLRSVVVVNETQIPMRSRTANLITGNSALITSPRNIANQIFDNEYYLYDPFGASIPIRAADGGPDEYFFNKPISRIEFSFASQANPVASPTFLERATSTGTIFIYAKSGGFTACNEIINI